MTSRRPFRRPIFLAAALALVAAFAASPARADRCDDSAKELAKLFDLVDRLRSQGIVPGSDEGGTPSGFFTGATGVTVYRGDAFPSEFRGNLFVGDVANNIVHRALPVPDGVLMVAKSAEEGRDFLASRDNAFRPVRGS